MKTQMQWIDVHEIKWNLPWWWKCLLWHPSKMDVMHCLTNEAKYYKFRQTTDTKMWLLDYWHIQETLVFEPWSVEAADLVKIGTKGTNNIKELPFLITLMIANIVSWIKQEITDEAYSSHIEHNILNNMTSTLT
jgi:hypothetical protein